MTKSMISISDLEFGKIYISFVYFDENDSDGKKRPVILFKNNKDTATLFKVSSKLDTPFNQKYGYFIKDWEQTGLNKPSVVKAHPNDIFESPISQLNTIIGELSDRDKIGLLEKHIEINRYLLRKRNNNLEL
ncbi:hypothetical protein [Paraliobacillus ryukyuensis]|uniref:hypothetical protein n=1 Tax=Paraliobacillus ryukyuensis TaxID=200904 RepID=UPI0009A84EA9|nr:hypothetical protein [Paraliobacillus ryukyuensis]